MIRTEIDIQLRHEPCPTVCPEDLLKFTIEPDLRDGKADRLKKLAARLKGTGVTVDNTGCLLQGIGPNG